MKKKILIVAMVLCILALTLVACLNDDNEELNTGEGLPPIKLTEDMTTQQIIDAINAAKNLTFGFGDVDEDNYMIIGETYFVYNYKTFDESYIQFMAGNKRYVAYLDFETKEVEWYKKVNFDGYDANLKKSFEHWMFYNKKEILETLNQDYPYEINDGNLRVYDAETNETYLELKDLNSSILVLPESFKDYKTREETNSPIEYELNSDETKYEITIASGIVSYEIPSSYNGLPVEVTYANVECVSELTLPSNITELKGQNYFFYYPEEEKEIHIIYRGTKEQWASIEKTSEWRTYTRVTCTDGEYVEQQA